MTVTPLLVKELREKTGAGMLECKKALEASDCDIEKAIVYLREKGIAKAEKKASRIAAEGLCNIVIDGNVAVLYEVNSETDFVAKNERFLDLLDTIGNILIHNDISNTEDALEVEYKGNTVKQLLLEATATIGEKISLRRVTRVEKSATQVFGSYKHMGGRIAALSVIEGDDLVVAKDIAMHVAASNPKYMSKDSIGSDFIETERHILLQTAINENNEAPKQKPQAIVEKMVEGRLVKYLQEICLLNQPFVKNPDVTVENHVKAHHCSLVTYVRLEVGEGIEKEIVNFADEVMQQAKLK